MKQEEARIKIAQAFSLVCGKQYQNLITSRIENTDYQFYFSISNAQRYLAGLEKIDTTQFTDKEKTKLEKMKAFYIKKIWLEQQTKQIMMQKRKLEIYHKIARKLPVSLKALLEKKCKNEE